MEATANQEDLLKRALLELRSHKRQLEDYRRRETEAVAIVGLSCRFPGGVHSLDDLWQRLLNGDDLVGEVPAGRFDAPVLHDPTQGMPGRIVTRRLAHIGEVDQFDNALFGLSLREAKYVDPQQRMLLELTWEALETAGIAPLSLQGSNTGVYVGVSQSQYSDVIEKATHKSNCDPYSCIGNAISAASGRISYTLGLEGPCFSVDTACSTSLVALHVACEALRSRQCDAAIVGAANLILAPATSIAFSGARMLSPEGKCKTFDDGADGYVRGDGVAVVVLKRLSEALADGDPIQAVIRGSAINQDGASGGLTVPSGPAQEKVIERALRSAGLHARDVGYVEAHGTGTPLGDPIEINALHNAYGKRRKAGDPLIVGTVKANMGHLELCAGLAGLFKTVACLQRGVIPQQLHFRTPNKSIDWQDVNIRVPTEPLTWSATTRRAGLSSFGFSGTNAHIILEQAPQPAVVEPEECECRVNCDQQMPGQCPHGAALVPLSAQSPKALTALVRRYLRFLRDGTAVRMGDVGFTAASGRSHFKYRKAFVASDARQLGRDMEQFLGECEGSGESAGVAQRTAIKDLDSTERRVGLLFSGQGSQWHGMASSLYSHSPVFRAEVDELTQLVGQHLGSDIKPLLLGFAQRPDDINQTRFTQPCLFVFEAALAKVWLACGIKPQALIGHSVGEIVAAYVAGVFSRSDAVKLVCARASLMQALPDNGGMLALNTSRALARELIDPYSETVSIAAINTPRQAVVAGLREHLQLVEQEALKRNIPVKWLRVSHAFHSPLMTPMLDAFREVAADIQYQVPSIPIVSNVSGSIDDGRCCTPEYWVEHVMSPVNFCDGIVAARTAGINTMIEVGPSPTLLGMAQFVLEDVDDIDYIASVSAASEADTAGEAGGRGWRCLNEAFARLYQIGFELAWPEVYAGFQPRRSALPLYPFDRQRIWLDELPENKHHVGQKAVIVNHPLLGDPVANVNEVDGEYLFESVVHHRQPDYFSDHVVFGEPVIPGAAYFEMINACVAHLQVRERCLLAATALEIAKPIIIGAGRHCHVQTRIRRVSDGFQVAIFSRELSADRVGEWELNVESRVVRRPVDAARAPLPIESVPFEPVQEAAVDGAAIRLRATPLAELDLEGYYRSLLSVGLEYKGAFRSIVSLRVFEDGALAQIRLPAELASQARRHHTHPALLDCCFQALGPLLTDGAASAPYVPVGIDELCFIGIDCEGGSAGPHERKPGLPEVYCFARLHPAESDGGPAMVRRADLQIYDGAGELIGYVRGLRLMRVSASAFKKSGADILKEWGFENRWQLVPPAATESGLEDAAAALAAQSAWLVFASGTPIENALLEQLLEQGQRLDVVYLAARHAAPPATLLQRFAGTLQLHPIDERACALRAAVAAIVASRPEGVSTRAALLWPLRAEADHDVAAAAARLAEHTLDLLQGVIAQKRAVTDLFLVTSGSQDVDGRARVEAAHGGVVWGLGKVFQNEHPEYATRLLDVQPPQEFSSSDTGIDKQVRLLLRELLLEKCEQQVALRGGLRYLNSLRPMRRGAMEAAAYKIGISECGDLENLRKVEIERRAPGSGEVEVEVQSVGLNFKDVLHALGMLRAYEAPHGAGRYEDSIALGFECSGRVQAVGEGVDGLRIGDRVIVQALGAMASHVTVAARQVVRMPEALSFEEAAALPTAFITAMYALMHLAGLKAGESVLIHAGAGGVGQAAIQIARKLGATVYVTASRGKWDFLRRQGVEHIMDSRSLDFAEQIMQHTGGRGVDVVLNSLNGEYIPKNAQVLAHGGRFIEIGKIDVWSESRIHALRPDLVYHVFDLAEVSTISATAVAALIEELFGWIARAEISVIPVTAFRAEDVTEAFRYLAKARNVGKVVINLGFGQAPATTSAAPIEGGSFLITGGTSGVGLAVATHLAERGARSLYLVNRRGASAEITASLAPLAASGCHVEVLAADCGDPTQLAQVLQPFARGERDLHGVIHAAGVLEDGMLAAMTPQALHKVLAPKVTGAWALHGLIESIAAARPDGSAPWLCCFSSISSLIGTVGQGNYAAANAFMDGLMLARFRGGRPAQSLHWGPWSEVGMAARMSASSQALMAKVGIGGIDTRAGLMCLDECLTLARPELLVAPVRWSMFLEGYAGEVPTYLKGFDQNDGADQLASSLVLDSILALEPQEQPKAVLKHLREMIAKVIGAPVADIRPTARLMDMGLDSLMAVELKKKVEVAFKAKLSTTVVFDYPTPQKLSEYLTTEIQAKHGIEPATATTDAGEPAEAAEAADGAAARMQQMSEDELSAILASELAADSGTASAATARQPVEEAIK